MDDALARFKAGLRGAVIARGDLDYEQARKLYNGMIDKHPLLIVRCADAAGLCGADGAARGGMPMGART